MNLIDSLDQMLRRFILYVPNVVAALVILAVGWLISSGLGRLTRKLVDKTRANERLEEHELSERGSRGASRLAGGVVFWGLFLITLGAAADALQIAVVSRTVDRIVMYIPRFVVAGVMLAIGVAVAGWLKRMIVRRSTTSSARLMGTAAQVAVIVLTSFMAARELDIGASILNTAFVLVIGAFSVAFAIAFGLGARSTAGRVADDWYERSTTRRYGTTARPYTTPERPVTTRPSTPSQA